MPRSRRTVVIAPDSFKGSLAAPDVCAAIGRGIARAWPDVELRARPMADGGEGTLDAVLAAVGQAGTRQVAHVAGAHHARVDAGYGMLADGVAVVEVAQVVGITDAAAMAIPVVERDTSGVGQLLRTLLDSGARRIMIGLGGSSTNDGGAGLLAALGLRLLDDSGNPVPPTPTGLTALARIDAAALDARIGHVEITIMSDVNNALTGARGATAIFGPQKGVAPAQVAPIDATLARFASLAEAALGRRAADNPGAGAAGGLGFALQLLGGEFRSGLPR